MVREPESIGGKQGDEGQSDLVSAEVIWDDGPTLVPDPLDDPERPLPPEDLYWRERRVKKISGL
jgi:hypothetical protein